MFLDQQRAVCFHPVMPVPHVPLDFRAKEQGRHTVNLKSTSIMVHLNDSFSVSMHGYNSVLVQKCCIHLQSYPPDP